MGIFSSKSKKPVRRPVNKRNAANPPIRIPRPHLAVSGGSRATPDVQPFHPVPVVAVRRTVVNPAVRLPQPGAAVANMRSETTDAIRLRIQAMVARQAKIDVAALAMMRFLRNVMGMRDRCSMALFNDLYHPVLLLASEPQCLAALLAMTTHCEGGTTLWDAICVAVIQFISTADPSRSWVLVILTDGDDSGSRSTAADATRALRLFNQPGNNYAFIVGLGRDVKADQLQRVATASGSLYVPVENTRVLDVLFALIALSVTTNTRVDLAALRTGNAAAIFARVQRQAQVRRNPVDMLFLVDISSSMTDQ